MINFEKVINIIYETDKIFFDDSLRNDVSKKGMSDYVTKADITISDYLYNRLKEEFPQIGFKSEEEKNSEDYNEYWILDPIDGTTNFMHELGLSAVSLGYCSFGEVLAGIIYIPYTKQLFYAEKGKGAFLNGEIIHCSNNDELSSSLGAIELNPYYKNDYMSAFTQAYNMFNACQDIRIIGSSAVSLAYIAAGKLDVFLGRYLKPWDYAAGKIIIEEAGGKLGEINGEVNINELNQHIVASNGILYEKFIKLLK